MTLTLRYMQMPDIPHVVVIDRLSFDPPWSMRSYAFEVSESSYSYMVVLEQQNVPKPVTGWRRFVSSLSGNSNHQYGQIIAYGGLWCITDEAHISTIATHPDWRGQGYGELMLAGMVRRAMTLDAAYIVLEVRVSNIVAQELYKKYDFEIVDTKPRYYHNNGEDAYDMRLNLRDDAIRARLKTRFQELMTRHQFLDFYTTTPPPRDQH